MKTHFLFILEKFSFEKGEENFLLPNFPHGNANTAAPAERKRKRLKISFELPSLSREKRKRENTSNQNVKRKKKGRESGGGLTEDENNYLGGN